MHPPSNTLAAHIWRRAVHLSNLIFLWIYYQFGENIAGFFRVSLPNLIWIVLGIVLALEVIRLWRGWTIFGQRHYESHHVSALTWGVIGSALVLLYAPGKAFVIPIISTYAICDPLLGELRKMHLPQIGIAVIGLISIACVWWLCHVFFGTPAWLIFLMAPVTLAAEWPCLKWIDDNALMQLVPLIIICLITSLLPA